MTETYQSHSATRALEIVQHLEACGALGAGGRLPALLRYLVSEELAGRGDRLKAYAIATEVLGRTTSFDPSQDSIVRVEVARLRRALDYYYATEGREEPLRITIPRGGYRPLIGLDEAADAAADDIEDVAPVSSLAHSKPAKRRGARSWMRSWALVVLLLFVVASMAFWLGRRQSKPVDSGQRPAYSVATPRLVLLPFEAMDEQAYAIAPGLRTQLAALLAQQNWLAVGIEEQFSPSGPLPPKVFSITGVVEKTGQGFMVYALMHQEPEHRVVWSGRYSSPLLHKSAVEMAGAIAGDIAHDLGYPLGPIGQAVAARSGETEPEVEDRFLCMMNAYRYWRGLEAKQKSDALACLERLAVRWPDFADGRAMLAMFALEDSRGGDEEHRKAGLAKAEAYLRGAPPRDRLSLTARMTLNACKGDAEEARKDAALLFSLAPNDPDTLSEVANAAGLGALDWSLALTAEKRAFELASVPHARYSRAGAAKKLLDGNYEGALAALSRVSQTNLPVGQIMLLSLATLADAPLRAQSAADSLSSDLMNNPQGLFRAIDASCWHPDVKAAFRAGLTLALEQRRTR